jgi:cytochrome c-type biogenesis protein CcmF
VTISNSDGVAFTAMPGLYVIQGPNGMQTMRWPYIYHAFSHDVYLALGDPITTVWDSPQDMAPNKVINANDMFSLKYNGIKMQGKPGQMGTKFIADLTMVTGGKTYHPQPSLTMTPSGLRDELIDAGPQFYVTLSGIQAGSDIAKIQVYFKQPIYPMELFYKPLTSLVWLGAGILFVGGLMAAFYRRTRSSTPNLDVHDFADVEEKESKEDALVTAP